MIVGATRAPRSQPAWRQAYRALEHGHARRQGAKLPNLNFPPQIQKFGSLFIEMQKERHKADYDPAAIFARREVLQRIKEVENAIEQFKTVDRKDRRALAVLVVLKLRI